MSGVISGGNKFFGTTYGGPVSGVGTVFSINTNGTGLTVLHSFTTSTNDGMNPYASLILLGNTLYGTTFQGGIWNCGTVFSLNTNGTGFTILHSFGYDSGPYPTAPLVSSGNILYGTTYQGGSSDSGIVFSINTNGTGFTVLHRFTGGDGANPYAGLVLSSGKLYGTTVKGGGFGAGTVFSLNIDGTGFTILHSFHSGLSYDAQWPYSKLILNGNTLYGTTYRGGASDYGTVFCLNTDGTGFRVLRGFGSGYIDQGKNPYSGVLLINDTLYGATFGTINGAAYPSASGSGEVFGLKLSPAISDQPRSVNVAQGSNTIFQVIADGYPSPNYQWRIIPDGQANAMILPGQNSSTLSLQAITNGNAGNYFVVVANNFGSVTSTVAKLTVFLPPQSFQASSTTDNQVAMQLTGTPNYPYILQSATNLTPPVNWRPVLTNPADGNGNWQFTDTNLNGSQKFYRAVGQ